VAKGTSDDEFAMFLWFCRNHQVDPVAGEVYCIMRWDSKREVVGKDAEGKPVYQGGMKMTIVMGIGGLRGLAARKHKDYGSTDDPAWTFGERKTPATRRIPESVTVAVWKKGAERPTKATIFWDEFAPKDLQTEAWKHDFWNRSPANQLAKCCEAQALRKAYPDLNNIYIPEELAQTDQDYTPSGRQIVTQDGTAPSGRAVTYEAQHRGQLSEEAPHGHPAGSEKAKQAEAQLAKIEEEDRRLKEAKAVLPKAFVPTERATTPEKAISASKVPVYDANGDRVSQ
jgi:phage recombination protein Bet